MNSISNGFLNLHEAHLQILQRPFTKEEVKRALFGMAPFKSPGNDGLHVGFFQKSWAIVGESLSMLSNFSILEFFQKDPMMLFSFSSQR